MPWGRRAIVLLDFRFRGRPTVGRRALDPATLVRIPPPEPRQCGEADNAAVCKTATSGSTPGTASKTSGKRSAEECKHPRSKHHEKDCKSSSKRTAGETDTIGHPLCQPLLSFSYNPGNRRACGGGSGMAVAGIHLLAHLRWVLSSVIRAAPARIAIAMICISTLCRRQSVTRWVGGPTISTAISAYRRAVSASNLPISNRFAIISRVSPIRSLFASPYKNSPMAWAG